MIVRVLRFAHAVTCWWLGHSGAGFRCIRCGRSITRVVRRRAGVKRNRSAERRAAAAFRRLRMRERRAHRKAVHRAMYQLVASIEWKRPATVGRFYHEAIVLAESA